MCSKIYSHNQAIHIDNLLASKLFFFLILILRFLIATLISTVIWWNNLWKLTTRQRIPLENHLNFFYKLLNLQYFLIFIYARSYRTRFFSLHLQSKKKCYIYNLWTLSWCVNSYSHIIRIKDEIHIKIKERKIIFGLFPVNINW